MESLNDFDLDVTIAPMTDAESDSTLGRDGALPAGGDDTLVDSLRPILRPGHARPVMDLLDKKDEREHSMEVLELQMRGAQMDAERATRERAITRTWWLLASVVFASLFLLCVAVLRREYGVINTVLTHLSSAIVALALREPVSSVFRKK